MVLVGNGNGLTNKTLESNPDSQPIPKSIATYHNQYDTVDLKYYSKPLKVNTDSANGFYLGSEMAAICINLNDPGVPIQNSNQNLATAYDHAANGFAVPWALIYDYYRVISASVKVIFYQNDQVSSGTGSTSIGNSTSDCMILREEVGNLMWERGFTERAIMEGNQGGHIVGFTSNSRNLIPEAGITGAHGEAYISSGGNSPRCDDEYHYDFSTFGQQTINLEGQTNWAKFHQPPSQKHRIVYTIKPETFDDTRTGIVSLHARVMIKYRVQMQGLRKDHGVYVADPVPPEVTGHEVNNPQPHAEDL